MESFLKYLRGGAVAGGSQRAPVVATTIAASACEDGGGGGSVEEDDASFFDLEFAVPGDESAASDAEEERVEFNFDVAGDEVASAAAEVVAVDAVAQPAGGESKNDGSAAEEEKKDAAQAAAATPVLRQATKFRVLLLKLRKPKAASVPVPGDGAVPPVVAAKTGNNRFLIKFRVDDAPLVSLFTRDNSSRASDVKQQSQQAQQQAEEITAEERLFAKEAVLRYINKIKPLYVKVARLRFPGGGNGASEGEETDASASSPSAPPSQPATPSVTTAPPQPQPVVVACGVRAPRASVPAGLKQVCKRLGKSRSASSAVAAAPSPSSTAPASSDVQAPPQRRDDSLLQLQDGIQSAIAHCKRSFNASKGSESPLLRSMTAPGDAARAADTKDGGDGA